MHYRTKKKIGKYVGTILAIIILSYTGFEMKDVIAGPRISVDSPSNGATVVAGLVSLTGSAEHIALLQVNGNELFTDLKGRFTKDILLSEGYNVIEVRAEDRFGRRIEKKIELVASKATPGTPVAQIQRGSF